MKLCPKCNEPVVFTFAMAYKEYGCVECNVWGEFLGSGFPEVTDTPELIKKEKERKEKWSADLEYLALRFGGACCVVSRKRVMDCVCEKCVKSRKVKPKYWKQNVLKEEVK